MLSTTRKILGPSTILQAAVPDILDKVPQAYFDNTMKVVQVCMYYMYTCVYVGACEHILRILVCHTFCNSNLMS